MRLAALGRLLRGELRGRRLRAMLLFVAVIALATAALVGGLEGQTKAGDRWDAAFAEANGAHVTIDGDAAAVAAVARRPEVAASTHTYRAAADELDVVVDGDALEGTDVREVPASDLPDIARPLLRDGRWAGAGAADELVLDRAFGLDEGIDVGDQIALATPAGAVAFTVVGRAVDLVDCFYPNCGVVSWVDPAGFERLGVDAVEMAFLRLRDPYAVEPFMASLSGAGVGTQDWIDTRDDALGVYEVFGAFLGAFGVFVMIAAAVVVGSSMATRAVARRHDIGLLKALGTTPRQVALSIVLSHALAAATGVAIGWVLGGFLAPLIQVDLGEILGTGGASFSAGGLLVAFVVVEAIVVVTTIVPAWRAGRLPTTAALATVALHGTRGRGVGRLPLGPVGLAGVRGVFGRPARSVLTALALGLALVAVLATAGVERTVDEVFGDPTLVGDPEELRVYPTGDDAAAVPAALDAEEGVASWFTETEQDLALGDVTFLGFALGGDVEHAGFRVQEGRMPARPGEAVAGWGLLDRFGLAVGDRVTVHAAGEPIDLTIVGWYREGEDTGQILRFRLDDLQRARPDAEPGWASVNVARGVEPAAVAARLGRTLGAAGHVELRRTEASDEIDAFRFAFLVVAALVVVVALANLASTMLLAVRERTHDLGVLRAVGVTPRQVVLLVATGAAALAVLAAVAGVPLAWVVSRAITEVVGAESGLGPGIGVGPGVGTALVVVPAAVVVAAILGALASRRGATAEVSELVRYE